MAASEYFESKYLGRLVVHIFSKKYVRSFIRVISMSFFPDVLE